MVTSPPTSTLFPYTTLFRSVYNFVFDLCVKLGAAPSDLVPFEKYAAAAQSLTRPASAARALQRSEEHTSELQSRPHLVCRLLLEKKTRRITEAMKPTSEVTS